MSKIDIEDNKSIVTKFFVINTLLLLCHIAYIFLFYAFHAPIMLLYNIISVITYMVTYVILYYKKAIAYTLVLTFEIAVFMLLGIMCIGWDAGFQLYSFAFLVSSLFEDLYYQKSTKISAKTFIQALVILCLYLFAKAWTMHHQPLYSYESTTVIDILHASNSIITFCFIAIYGYIYSSTVHRLEIKLTNMAEHDVLTGLYNRRKILDKIAAIENDSDYINTPIAVAILDIDFFKNINDTFGHDAGDDVLFEVGQSINNILETLPSTLIGRWGGEEFIFIFDNYENEDDVIDSLNTLRLRIENDSYYDSNVKSTVTIGVSFLRGREGIDINMLIKEADQKLYYGKQNGRNTLIEKIEY